MIGAPLMMAPARVPSTLLNGLLAYWALEGNGVDSSGNARVLSPTVTPPTYVAGKFGQGSKFSAGVQDALATSDSGLPMGNSPRAISMWLKRPGNPGTGPTTYRNVIGYGTAGPFQMLDVIAFSQDALAFAGYPGSFAGLHWYGNPGYECLAPYTPDTWSHLLFSYDADLILRGYGNGVQFGTGWGPLNLGTIAFGNLLLGGGSYGPFNGGGECSLDEVSLYNRGVTGAEALELFNAGAGKFFPDY